MLAAIACIWIVKVDEPVRFNVGFLATLPGDSLEAMLALGAYDPKHRDFTFAWDKLVGRSQSGQWEAGVQAAAHETMHAIQFHRGRIGSPHEEPFGTPEQLAAQLATYQARPHEVSADEGAAQFFEAIQDVERNRAPSDVSQPAERYKAQWGEYRAGQRLYGGRDMTGSFGRA
jgi:hypothetical protein